MDFPPVYGTLNENRLVRVNQEGDTDIYRYLYGIPLSGKSTMSEFKTAKQRYTVDFPLVYGTLNENQPLRAQQNQEGDTDIPGIPLSGEKDDVAFYFYLVFNDVPR